MIWHAPLKAEYTPSNVESTQDYSNFSPWDLLNYDTLSYDRILDFVDMIENTENLENVFTEKQQEEIQDFLIFLMRNGIRDWDVEAKEILEEDIAWMKGEPNNSSLAYEDDDDEQEEEEYPDYWVSSFKGYPGIKILPAVLGMQKKPEVVLCKGKLDKFWKSVKRASKRHKKEIIIAAVVVVATVVIIATGGAATPEAVVGSSAAIAGGSKKSKDKDDDGSNEYKPRDPINKPGEVYCRDEYQQLAPQDSSYQNDYAQNISPIERESHRPQLEESTKLSIPTKEVVQQQSAEIKEELAEIISDEAFNLIEHEKQSFWQEAKDKARETGSHITHEVYEAVTDQFDIIPQISGALSDKLPNPLKGTDPFEKDPRESYQEMVEAGHEKIDEIFGTDQADMYAADGKAARGELTTGMLPPPGGITKTSSKFFEKNIKHIFRNEPGHLIDTPANRKILLEVSGDPKNFIGVDKHGNSWHAKIQKDGTQVWCISRNGEVRDAGVNKKIQTFHKETGLSNNEKPQQK